jgi:hypothetical protein
MCSLFIKNLFASFTVTVSNILSCCSVALLLLKLHAVSAPCHTHHRSSKMLRSFLREIFFYVVCLLGLLCDMGKATFTLPHDEFMALCDLYNTAGGSSWTWDRKGKGAWDCSSTSTQNPCTAGWKGVTCTTDCSISPCYVEQLTLNEMNLQGYIPSSLGNLTYLTYLSLQENYVIGSIPISFSKLTSLNHGSIQ